MPLEDIYTENIHDNLRMYASWPIDISLALGDYGTLERNTLQRIGNITERYGIPIKSIASTSSVHYDYRSAGMVELSPHAKGEVKVGTPLPLSKAGLDINFSGENAIFFEAAGCKTISIMNKDVVFDSIIKLYQQGKWDKKHKIITDIVNADSATIIVSSGNNASISIEADSPDIKIIDLAKASIRLNSISEKNIGLKVISAGNLTPLFRIGGMSSVFWPFQNPVFRQLAAQSDISEIVTIQTLD